MAERPGSATAPERSIGRSSLVMAAGTVLSRGLGFLRSFLIVAVLGMSTTASNAFMTGNQIPTLLYSLTAGGILTAVLVPQIVQAARGPDQGAAYINKVMTLALVGLLALTVVLFVLTPLITRAFTPTWSGRDLALATAFTYWCMPQVFFYGLYALLGGIYNARSVFGPYTWAPVLNNVVAIAGLLAFLWIFGADPNGEVPVSDWTPSMIALIGSTATAGVAAQALIMFAWWRRSGLRYRPDLKLRGVGLGPTFKAAAWILGMVALDWLHSLVKANVANSTEPRRAPGDLALMGITSFETVSLIQLLPHAIVTVSIATVYFTRLSEHAADHDRQGFIHDFSGSARQIGLVTIFAGTTMATAAFPISRVFSTDDFGQIQAFARLVALVMPFVVVVSLNFLVMRCFYSLDRTRIPFLVAAVRMVLMLPLYWLASQAEAHWVVFWLVAVSSTAVTFDTVLMLVLLRRALGSIDGFRLLRSHVRMAAAVVPAAAVGFVVAWALGSFHAGGFAVSGRIAAIASCAAIAAAMGLVYLGGLKMLHVCELDQYLSGLRRIAHRN